MKRIIIFSILFFTLLSDSFAEAPILIGRRGCGYAIENTADAYREAVRRGFSIIEAHVRATADSVFVTSHDGKTDRLGGHMKISASTIDSLRTERYRQSLDSMNYEGSTICTVGEFLDICAANNVTPLLHLKTFSKNTKDCGYLTPLVRLISDKGLTHKCIVLTSEPDYIDYFLRNHPEINLQYQADAKWRQMFDWSCSRKLDVQIRADLIDDECIRLYHDNGCKVNAWTINTEDDYNRMKKLGIDFIVTDYLVPDISTKP